MRAQVTLGALVFGALLTLAGCTGSAVTRPSGEGPEAGAGADAAAGAQAGTAQVEGGFQGSPLEDPNSPLSKRVFYFAFDSSELSTEDRDILAAHARYLASHPELSVVLTGNADERGSREYNLALGERRAVAVEKLLELQGAGKEQLRVISYGEEQPAAMGHDEKAWSLNRRVELQYSGI